MNESMSPLLATPVARETIHAAIDATGGAELSYNDRYLSYPPFADDDAE